MNEQPIDLIFERSANEIRRSHAGTIQDFALANSCNATDRLIAEVERLTKELDEVYRHIAFLKKPLLTESDLIEYYKERMVK